MSTITIAGRQIGPSHPTFIVAEMSGEHCHDFERALALVRAAKDAGADAVKSQCFTPDEMTRPGHRIVWQGQERDLYDLYAETAMPMEWHAELKAYAESLGLVYFTSVFSPEDVDLMDVLGILCFKIASFELTDLSLIRYAAMTGKPLVLSTGMATRAEIYAAIIAVQKASPLVNTELALLKCVSAYPADASDSNLRTLQHYWGWPTGLSDHTLGIAVPVAAVALGACIIEKHLTLSCADGGPDAAFSLEPAEFKAMVEAVRIAEQALGEVKYGPTESEREMVALRRSLWVVRGVRAGEPFTAANLRSLRPASGLMPKHWDDIIGKRAKRDVTAGTAMTWGMVE